MGVYLYLAVYVAVLVAIAVLVCRKPKPVPAQPERNRYAEIVERAMPDMRLISPDQAAEMQAHFDLTSAKVL